MTRSIALASLLLLLSGFSYGQQKTVVNDANGARLLLGDHSLSLQWVSWDHPGKATIKNKAGVYSLLGSQKSRSNTDFVIVDGTISSVNAKEFTFVGEIITQVSHINGRKPCKRSGEFIFRITGKRKYWRMQQIDNPCEAVADYVDLYLR